MIFTWSAVWARVNKNVASAFETRKKYSESEEWIVSPNSPLYQCSYVSLSLRFQSNPADQKVHSDSMKPENSKKDQKIVFLQTKQIGNRPVLEILTCFSSKTSIQSICEGERKHNRFQTPHQGI